ncbi:TniQ family protein [Nonomuraea sp. NPDC005983]|uniref:TniQ family protein n=1 Tax=Nonomuraea sp. NPDC005983 TaxID=3155595 RepID=UPI00339FA1E7
MEVIPGGRSLERPLPWAAPRRALPRRVRPIQDETVPSYLRRMAIANHLPERIIREALGLRRGHRHPPLEVLATLAGLPAKSLLYALPDMRTGRTYPDLALHGRSIAGRPNEERLACRLCMAEKAVLTQVHCWMRHDQNVCLHHQIWIGPGDNEGRPQLSLIRLPEVVLAQRHHQRLIRLHGRDAIRIAFEEALVLHIDWLEHPLYAQRRHERFGNALGADWRVRQGGAVFNAVGYPEAVGLASVLVLPRWRAPTASRSASDFSDFCAAIREVAPHYAPRGGRDPLLHWLEDRARSSENSWNRLSETT